MKCCSDLLDTIGDPVEYRLKRLNGRRNLIRNLGRNLRDGPKLVPESGLEFCTVIVDLIDASGKRLTDDSQNIRESGCTLIDAIKETVKDATDSVTDRLDNGTKRRERRLPKLDDIDDDLRLLNVLSKCPDTIDNGRSDIDEYASDLPAEAQQSSKALKDQRDYTKQQLKCHSDNLSGDADDIQQLRRRLKSFRELTESFSGGIDGFAIHLRHDLVPGLADGLNDGL